jgi:hypothetical protein
MQDEKRITIPVSIAFHRQAKTKAAQSGLQLSVIARALFGAWLRGDVKIDKAGAVIVGEQGK